MLNGLCMKFKITKIEKTMKIKIFKLDNVSMEEEFNEFFQNEGDDYVKIITQTIPTKGKLIVLYTEGSVEDFMGVEGEDFNSFYTHTGEA